MTAPDEFLTCWRYPASSGGPPSTLASSGAPRPRHPGASCGHVHVTREAAVEHTAQLEDIESDRTEREALARGENIDEAAREWNWYWGRADGLCEYQEEFNARVNATISPEACAVIADLGRRFREHEARRALGET